MVKQIKKTNISEARLTEWIRVCGTLQALKELPRQGSLVAGLNRGDSDTIAGHTYSVATTSFIFASELKGSLHLDIDPSKVAAMGLVHDLPSAITGDINAEIKGHYFPSHDRGEKLALTDLLGEIASSRNILSLYNEYKDCRTIAAKVVRFSNGLDGWLEVIPRASLAYMDQHLDYRDRISKQLNQADKNAISLADMYSRICDILIKEKIPPKRPAANNSKPISNSVFNELAGLPLRQEELVEILQILLTLQRLKRLPRQGFITSGGFNRWDTDSIADHAGLVGLIALTLSYEVIAANPDVELNPNRVVAMALIHDIAESVLGDVNSETKTRYYLSYGKMEKKAFSDLIGDLHCANDLIALFKEFDECITTDAKLVRFADSIDAWQRVVPLADFTWMPQHVRFRNKTVEKLRGDLQLGDALADMFLRACLEIQGNPIGPRGRPLKIDQSVQTGTLMKLGTEIDNLLGVLSTHNGKTRKIPVPNAEVAYAFKTLLGLKEKLLALTEKYSSDI